MEEIKYENPEICSICKGKCCKIIGCHYSPDDFEQPITLEYLREKIKLGNISIDYWEEAYYDFPTEHRQGFFLRSRHKNSEICDASWGGECILLTDTGCKLPFQERPKGGRMLIPDPEGKLCKSHYLKEDSVRDWLPYHDILLKLWIEFK